MEMDRRLSLQQQMGSGGLHQVHSSPNITSPSSNNSQPHPPQPPAAPPAPPAAPPAPPGINGFSKLIFSCRPLAAAQPQKPILMVLLVGLCLLPKGAFFELWQCCLNFSNAQRCLALSLSIIAQHCCLALLLSVVAQHCCLVLMLSVAQLVCQY